MKQTPIVIFAGDSTWKLASGNLLQEIPSSAGSSAEKIAGAVAEMLGPSAANITLAISASWCLSATVSLNALPARNRRNSLLYRLELLLPLTAEDIAADYIFSEPDTALAVCVSTSVLKPFVDALEAAGIAVDSIIPASVFAVQSLLVGQKPNALNAVVWQSNDTIELFRVCHDKIVSWYVFSDETEDLRWHIDQLIQTEGDARQVIAYNVTPKVSEILKTSQSLSQTEIREQTIEQGVISAMTAGRLTSVELRRDGLALGNAFRAVQTPLREMVAAFLFLVVCICAAALWRASRLEHIAAGYRDRQEALFREVFPGHSVPVNLVSRLRSEVRRLDTGSGADAVPVESAPPTLHSILLAVNSLPADARFQLKDLTINDSHFSFDGLTRKRSDLNSLVEALGNVAHLQVDPPQTEQNGANGLHMSVTGTGPTEQPRK